MATFSDGRTHCDVCWGSHACVRSFRHEGHHVCCCTDPEKHWRDQVHIIDDDQPLSGARCVGTWPYYGPGHETRFYGEDVPEGWPQVKSEPDSEPVLLDYADETQ